MLIPLSKMFLSSTLNLVILLVFACDNTLIVSHQDLNEQIVVLSLLSPAFDKQEVYVGIALPEVPPSDVSGATVQVSDSTNTYTFKEVRPGLYRDLHNELQVIPGNDYHLYVKTLNGKTVTAQTQVPSEFKILNIAQGDTVEQYSCCSGPRDTEWFEFYPDIEYELSLGSLVYQILFDIVDSTFRIDETILTVDTRCEIPHLGIGTIKDTSYVLPVQIIVLAWDSSYSKYAIHWATRGVIPNDFSTTESFSEFMNQFDYYEQLKASNINGGLGILGSASVASVQFYLKRRHEIRP